MPVFCSILVFVHLIEQLRQYVYSTVQVYGTLSLYLYERYRYAHLTLKAQEILGASEDTATHASSANTNAHTAIEVAVRSAVENDDKDNDNDADDNDDQHVPSSVVIVERSCIQGIVTIV